MKKTCIYGLFDPRQSNIIMYVGKGLKRRAQLHWRYRKTKVVNSLVRNWFERLEKEGIEPSWRFLEENVINWEECERYWIAYWREKNPDLCNIADGGNQ